MKPARTQAPIVFPYGGLAMNIRGSITSLIVTLAIAFAQAAQAQKEPPRLTIVQELKIDGVEQDLVPIRSIAVDRTGNIAIVQQQDGAIRFFSASGAPLGKVGRKGGGPGEFDNFSAIGWKGDSLWVYDSDQARYTLITPDRRIGRVLTTTPMAAPPASNPTHMPRFAYVTPRALLPGGGAIAHVGIGISAEYNPPREWKSKLTLARLNTEGNVERVIASINTPPPSAEVYGSDGKFMGNVSLPYVSSPMDAASPDGSRLFIVDASIDGANAGTFAVTALDREGKTVYNRRYPFAPVPLSRHVADSAINANYTRIRSRGGVSADLANAYKREAHIPPMYPPLSYAGLVVGRDLSAWINIKSPDRAVYYRISPEGNLAGAISLPKNATLAAADKDHVWVLEADEDDIQSVVRYRIAGPIGVKR
jgi:hypothetical protein